VPEKVTALIPAGNEAHQIKEAIESVLWADEVLVVVDEAATDGTADTARSFPDPKVRVLVHPYEYPALQKNWAIPQASHPWIFLIDADERPTPELSAEIRTLLQDAPPAKAYWIYRENVYFGRVLKHGGLRRDKVVRLFRRELRYDTRLVHEEIEDRKDAGFLSGTLRHCTFRDWDHYLEKLHRYTTWGALQDYHKGKRSGVLNIVFRPIHRFLKQYVLRLGFLDGIPGALVAYLAVYGVFLKYAKLWDLQKRGGFPGEEKSPRP
jgi:glycosyltransferase involved in cell wall biosynthesis